MPRRPPGYEGAPVLAGVVSELDELLAADGVADEGGGYASAVEYVLLLVEPDAGGADDVFRSAGTGNDSEEEFVVSSAHG